MKKYYYSFVYTQARGENFVSNYGNGEVTCDPIKGLEQIDELARRTEMDFKLPPKSVIILHFQAFDESRIIIGGR